MTDAGLAITACREVWLETLRLRLHYGKRGRVRALPKRLAGTLALPATRKLERQRAHRVPGL